MSEKTEIIITGMTCAACSGRIEKRLSRLPGVEEASVNLATERANIVYDKASVKEADLIEAIKALGFGTMEPAKTAESEVVLEQETVAYKARELTSLGLSVIAASILSAPLVLAMILALLGYQFRIVTFLHLPLTQFILATPVQFIIGARYYRGAWHNLRALSPGMDVLVAMGTSAAYFFSVYNGFFAGGHSTHQLYFEASAVVITLVLLGKYFETLAKGKTSEAIKQLIGLQPKTARVIRDGVESEIRVSLLVPGDRIIVTPGEKVAVDGLVLDGVSTLDESMVTGESLPVDKNPGDRVIGGTINKFGTFTFKATKVGRDTMLAQIVKIVEQAQGSKAPVQRLADQVSAVFVPAVLVIALMTFFFWWLILHNPASGLISAVAVLVISCPCALGLATPTAIMVGTGLGAQHGLLIKNGESLEKACRINTIVFDKTGTLTNGKPILTDLISLGEMAEAELLAFAGSAEKRSEHPLAQAIYEAAARAGDLMPAPTVFEAIPGKGIKSVIAEKTVLIGNNALLVEYSIDPTAETQVAQLEGEGKTTMYIVIDNKIEGLIALADTLKLHAAAVVSQLKASGIAVYMVTGDNLRTARAIARQAGIENVIAEVLPAQKAEKIASLKAEGRFVAMVGDGINDAPALSTADVGIALGTGTDIAMEVADITLIKGDLESIPRAMLLSRKTIRKIRQNLFWAFFYNVIGIPVAAMGFLNPVIAGAAMAFSSVSVVTNSLSLKKIKLK